MSFEFIVPQVTVSGINFALISKEINKTLLVYQKAIANFNEEDWQSLDPSFLASIKTDRLQDQQIQSPETLEENLPKFTPTFTDESIREFKQIILEDYGIELADQQAFEDATAFLGAFKLLTDADLIQKDSIDTERKEYGNVSESTC